MGRRTNCECWPGLRPVVKIACRVARIQAFRSSFSFNAALTVRFQTGFPALAALLAVLCSSLVATKRFRFSRMISNTNLFSARLTMSKVMTSSSIFTLLIVTRSGICSSAVSKFHQAAVRFLPFFTVPRLSWRAATRSITLLLAGLGGAACRFSPLALASISF